MLTSQNDHRARSALALGAATLFLAITAAACDEFLKPRRYNGPTGGTPLSDGGYSDSGDGGYDDPYACSACVSPMCNTQQFYCNQSQTCLSIQQSVGLYCGDYDLACVQSIVGQAAGDPQGQQIFANLFACERNTVCSSSCRDECRPPSSFCP